MKKIAWVIILSALNYGCGGGDNKDKITITDNSTNSPGSTIVRSATLPNSIECEAGGIQIESGIDSNTNGKLDTDEIDITKVVCNGTTGYNSLIKIADESIGTNCASGGKSINAGKDLNRNDILDSDEIDDTQFICNGLAGEKGDKGLDSGVASSCTVADNGDGTSTISCPDGTSSTISDGATGASSSCEVADNGDGTKTLSCSDGSSVIVSDGANGQDGSSCNIIDNGDGTGTLSCPDGTSFTLNNNDVGAIQYVSCLATIQELGVSTLYNIVQFSSTDILASAGVFSATIGTESSRYYNATQLGYSTGNVDIRFDIFGSSNNGTFDFDINKTTLELTIQYQDPDILGGSVTYTQLPNACSTVI